MQKFNPSPSIKAEDVRLWLNEQESMYASRSSTKGSLRFMVHGGSIFRIYENGVLILETANLMTAVDEYNSKV